MRKWAKVSVGCGRWRGRALQRVSAQGWLGTHRRVLEVHVRFHRRRELDHLGHTVRDDAEHEENADLRDLHTT